MWDWEWMSREREKPWLGRDELWTANLRYFVELLRLFISFSNDMLHTESRGVLLVAKVMPKSVIVLFWIINSERSKSSLGCKTFSVFSVNAFLPNSSFVCCSSILCFAISYYFENMLISGLSHSGQAYSSFSLVKLWRFQDKSLWIIDAIIFVMYSPYLLSHFLTMSRVFAASTAGLIEDAHPSGHLV